MGTIYFFDMTGEENKDKKIGTATKIKTGIQKALTKIGGKIIIISSFVIILVLLFLVITFITLSAVYVNEMNGVCVEANEFGSSSKIVRATAESEDDFTIKQAPKYEEITEKIRVTDLKLTLNNDPIVINISGKWLPWRANSIFKKPNESFICMLEKVSLPEDARFSDKEEENEFYYIKNYYNDIIVNKLSDKEIKVIGVAEAPERQKNCWVTRGAGLYMGMFGANGRTQPTSYHHLLASKMICAKSYWFGKNINDNAEYIITKYYTPAKNTDKKTVSLRLNKVDGSLRTLFSQEEGGYTRGSDYYKLLSYKENANNYITDLEYNYRSVFGNKLQENLVTEYENEDKEEVGEENSNVFVPINNFKTKLSEIKNLIKELNDNYKYEIENIPEDLISKFEYFKYKYNLYIPIDYNYNRLKKEESKVMEKERLNDDLKRILNEENKCEIPAKQDENGNDVKDSNGKIIRQCPCAKELDSDNNCPDGELKTCCDLKYNEDLKLLQYFSSTGEVKENIRNDVISLSIVIIDKLKTIVEKIDKDLKIMESNDAKIEYKDNVASEKLKFVEKNYTLDDFKRDYFTLESYGVSSTVGTESSKILTIEGNQIIYDIDLHERLLHANGKVKNPTAIVAESISMFDKACYYIDKDQKGNVIRKDRAYFQYGPKILYKYFSESEDIRYEYGERVKMLIADKYYSDNDGFYNIEIISGINFDDSGTIASKLREVEFYFLGTPKPGSDDDRADGMIATIFNNLLNTGFAKFARAVMALYIVVFGFRIIFGFKKNNRDRTPIKMSDLMMDLAKMVMVVAIISPSGFQFFNKIILNFTINGVIGIVDILAGVFSSDFMNEDNFMAMTGGLNKTTEVLSLARNFKVIDEILSLFKNDTVMLKIFSLFYNFKTDFFAGIPVGFGVLIIILMYLFKLFKVIIPFFFTLIQMTLVLPLAPLFLLFNFFEQTKYLFKNWLKFILQKCLEIIAFFTAFYFMTFIINEFIKKLLLFKVCFGRLGDYICKTSWNGECGGTHFIRKIIVGMFNCIIYMEKEDMPNGNDSFFKYYMVNILICILLLILFEEITKMISSIIGSILVIDDANTGGLGGNSTLGDFEATNKFGSLTDFANTTGLSEIQGNSDALKWTRSFVDLGKNPTQNLMDLGKKAYDVYAAGGEARIEAMHERIDDKVQDSLKEGRSIGERWEDFKKRREKYHNSVRSKKKEKRKEVMEKDFKDFNDSFGRNSMFDAIGLVRGEHKNFWYNKSGNNVLAKAQNWFTEKSIRNKNRLKDFMLGINKSAEKQEKAALRNQGYYTAYDEKGNIIKMSFKDGNILRRNENNNIIINDNIIVKEDGTCIVNVGEVEYIISNEDSEYIIKNKDGDKIIEAGKVEEILNSIKEDIDDAGTKDNKQIMEEKMEKINKKIEKFKKMEEEQKKLEEKNN